MRRSALLGVMFVLAVTGCGSPEPGPGTQPGQSESGTTTPQQQTETTPAQSGASAYSVLLVANVPSTAADDAMQEAADAGFSGFVKEVGNQDGYTVHHPGLTRDQAQAMLDEIRASSMPTAQAFAGMGLDYGAVWETARLP